jgi:hypothetical protein
LTTADFDLHSSNRPDFRNFSSVYQGLDTAGVMAWQRRAAVILDDHLIGVVARLIALTNRSGLPRDFDWISPERRRSPTT